MRVVGRWGPSPMSARRGCSRRLGCGRGRLRRGSVSDRGSGAGEERETRRRRTRYSPSKYRCSLTMMDAQQTTTRGEKWMNVLPTTSSDGRRAQARPGEAARGGPVGRAPRWRRARWCRRRRAHGVDQQLHLPSTDTSATRARSSSSLSLALVTPRTASLESTCGDTTARYTPARVPLTLDDLPPGGYHTQFCSATSSGAGWLVVCACAGTGVHGFLDMLVERGVYLLIVDDTLEISSCWEAGHVPRSTCSS